MRTARLLALAASLALAAGLPARADDLTPPLDPAVVAVLAQVSAARLRATDTRLVAFGTRSTLSEHDPGGRGIFAARDWVAEQFREIARHSNGRLTVRYDEYLQPTDPAKRTPRPVVISSVIATLRGDDPTGRTVVMSSHLDSRVTDVEDAVKDAPGADDNGSAVSAVLEAARVMVNLPVHAAVVFACFDAEEQGLLGSAHFARTLQADAVPVEGDLNNDIVGASVGDDGVKRDDYVRIFSEAIPAEASVARVNALGTENDSPSRELARFAKTTGDAYDPGFTGHLIFRADRFLRGGDHESFNAAGYAALRFTEPRETFAHQHQDVRVENGVQYGDLLRYVDFDYLAKVTRYNIASLATMALGAAVPVVTVDTKNLSNDTTLAWTAVPGAVRYEVVRRASTDAQWTSAQDAGNVTKITIPYSKDDWQFGVVSVDAAGHRSPAGFPTPVR
ncbi:MAG TPA: M28 family peptidase [Candidatus Sulfotelmatobacter sp.]|nr:M28 family peptidase [Candidatus Sulfotelmatobacter sp.]